MLKTVTAGWEWICVGSFGAGGGFVVFLKSFRLCTAGCHVRVWKNRRVGMCSSLSGLARPSWGNAAGRVTGRGLSWGSINSISVYVMKSGSRGLLQHSAEGIPGGCLSGERLNSINPWLAAWAALPSSNGSLLIIWGGFVCVARSLLFKQLAGNGDEGSLNSLLIKDQWFYFEKIEYRCKLYLVKELNVSLTFLFCFFSATGARPSFLRLLFFLVVLHFKMYLDYKNKLCWCFSSQVLTKSLRFCKIFKK